MALSPQLKTRVEILDAIRERGLPTCVVDVSNTLSVFTAYNLAAITKGTTVLASIRAGFQWFALGY